MLFTAIALLPELTVAVPSNNDDATHFLLIQRASEALANGENVLDHWVPQLELGFPWFIYYQPLPALVVVLLHRALFGLVDLLTVFNAVRYVLLVGLPITVFWSLRRMGVAAAGAAMAAAASPLLSGDFRYGFDYDSYIWRGFGMFTQLAAMHLSFVTVAVAWSSLRSRKRSELMWLAVALAALVLTHLIYAYMMALTLGVLALVGAESRADIVRRVLRLGSAGIPAAVLSAWLWLPFIAQPAFLGASPYLQAEKYDSYGAPAILGWLVTGDLMDHGRLPVITALVALGVVAAAFLRRTPLARTTLVLFVVWLVLYFGRPTLDGLVSLFPMHDGLLLHRFIGSFELFAIVLIGIGAAWAYDRARSPLPSSIRNRLRLAPSLRLSPSLRVALAGMVALLLLAPAIAERASFYASNTSWMRQTQAAIDSDVDARTILSSLRTRPPGRVFAGLRSTGYGPQMDFQLPFNSVRFSDLLVYSGVPVVAAPYSSLSLNADLIWDFAIDRPEDYQLFDVRYVVAPSGTAMPAFLQPITRTTRYVLYAAPTTGYAIYGAIVDRESFHTQRGLFAVNRPWFNGADVAALRFHRFDFPAASDGPTAAEESSGCARPAYTYERVQPSRIDVVVGCPAASTLVFKVTYHPNWHVTVDGRDADTFMVSPSFVGVSLPAGDHFVTAEYRSTPIKAPLFALAVLVLVAMLAIPFAPRLRPRVTDFYRGISSKVRSRLARPRSALES
ncbi:MAG TPA: 6-pyruvoyl-tetrahydropterin synthase-related protein [Candidatus Limnocylindria bacterium]